MKIFGFNIVTKGELKDTVYELGMTVKELEGELAQMNEKYPLELGETVYDIALKNAQGKYTKTKPSREHCTITEVEVNEKNYFNLKKRLENNDVFFEYEDAEQYLDSVCK